MAVKLNLLPENYTLTGPMAEFVKIARPLNVILLAFFLIMGLGMGAYFIFNNISLTGINNENQRLKNQIQTMSQAQQQIVLLKDRLGQIKKAQTIPEASKKLTNISPILSLVTENSYISELELDAQKTAASIIFKSNADLTNFLKEVRTNKNYSTITLGTFNYSPAGGYQVNMSFTDK